MVSEQRWKAAQEYEHGFWEGAADRVGSNEIPAFDWYRWRAEQLSQRLERCGLGNVTSGSAKVIEIGSGPVGLVNDFEALERLAIDPLSDYYSSDERLTKARNPAVEHRKGMGEELPAKSGHYDLVVIENCIDHTRDPDAVMTEIVRVLSPGGALYLTVNSRTPWWGYWIHRILSRLRLDPGHPHTFTPRRAKQLLAKHGFRVIDEEVGSAFKAHREDWTGHGWRGRAKAALGVSEYLVSLIARRQEE